MANCAVCGTKLGLKKVMIKDKNYLCYDCVKAAGYHPMTWTDNLKTSIEEIHERINGVENATVDALEMTVTHSIGNMFMIDDNHKLWRVQGQFGLHKGGIYHYEDILDYELLEDGISKVKGGLGSALVGGMAFGSVGAIVGSNVGKKTITEKISSMSIKITLNNINHPTETIHLLQMKVAKNSAAYKKAFEQAQQILSILKIMTNQ